MINKRPVLALPALRIIVACSALLISTALRPAAAAATETCIVDWAQASLIVQKRNMIDVARLSKLARDKYQAKIMSARLCHVGRNYFYRLVLRGDNGRVQQVKVDVGGRPD